MGDLLALAFWLSLAAVVWRVGHPRNADMASLQRERRRRNALARIGEEVHRG